MEMPAPDTKMQTAPALAKDVPEHDTPAPTRIPAIIVGVVVAAVAALSIWYLVRGEPLLVQGEVDATRLNIAARVDGRVADIPVVRGQNVPAGAVLVRIDNPETIAKHQQALAAKVVAEAQLANINVGTRVEVIAARKAAHERAQASVVLAQKTYDRVRELAEHGNAPQARLDEANVGKAVADIKAVQSVVDQMVVYAPVASQVYQRNVEPGEYISPGVPLVTLIDLDDMWVHF